MKIKISYYILIFVSAILMSCHKEPVKQTTIGTQLVRIQQGTDPATDTVYHISYNNVNKIDKITDSTNYTTYNAVYNANGKLVKVLSSVFSAEYSYDATGLLTGMTTNIAGVQEQFVIAYNNGIITEKKWYTDVFGGGTLSLWETFKYTVTDGNITNIKEYRSDSSLVSDKELRYDFQPNPFKELSLFNFGNILGASEIFNTDTYFNRNILYGYVIDNKYYEANENSYLGSDSDILTGIEAYVPDNSPEGFQFLTWQFSYK
jgi:YD repeat-containing protein